MVELLGCSHAWMHVELVVWSHKRTWTRTRQHDILESTIKEPDLNQTNIKRWQTSSIRLSKVKLVQSE
jgi:hypothetical protein